ncbi:MAG: hypothetical protein L0027_14865 [Candidatus Rokubacteria bacterium]|nr:hypothetical protein [Candidatus Rokubacteria bacterium]
MSGSDTRGARTASALLAELCRRGLDLRLDKDRLSVSAPATALTPAIRAALIVHKPEVVRLLGLVEHYQELLTGAFTMAASRRGPSAGDCARFKDEQARLVDDLGPTLAAAVLWKAATQWRKETSVCPVCGTGECRHHLPSSRDGLSPAPGTDEDGEVSDPSR